MSVEREELMAALQHDRTAKMAEVGSWEVADVMAVIDEALAPPTVTISTVVVDGGRIVHVVASEQYKTPIEDKTLCGLRGELTFTHPDPSAGLTECKECHRAVHDPSARK